ncbi:ABC transporter permease [Asticcacaulis endophyticus]|uniref:ABC transporter permease n=1 Tax=Asticcacaulis endophyticus TaxID=1395890 RepID=A0A918QGY1_9CAUL|nr:ABC transporter permease [Asticcacaulis endophyticus]GGZ45038.1 ABC transporter permease [Asticcacaulis endophyticus]
MGRSTFIAFYRSFTRHPLYAMLNLLGLSFGIAVFIALSLLYRFETSYETWSPERDKIHVIGGQYFFPGMPDDIFIGSMGGLLEEMKAAYPHLEGVRDWSNPVTVHKGAEVYAEQIELVDANYLSFFKVPMLHGDAATALNTPNSIALSEDKARKYFGTTDAVGKTITLSDTEGRKAYTVSAVMRNLPKNTDSRLDFARLLTPQRMSAEENWHEWGSIQLLTYFKFRDPKQAATLQAQFPAFVNRQVGDRFGSDAKGSDVLALHLVPLADVHLIDPQQKAAIVSLGMVGVVALVLALINYVNLATARAGLRAREVAVRKTLGANPGALRRQFQGEAALTLLLAFLIGLSLVELSLPLINAVGGLNLRLDYRSEGLWLGGILSLVMVAGLIAAIYPAFALSAFKPAQVLASSRTPAGGHVGVRLREALVVMQFATVVIAFVLMIGFMRQIDHMQKADLGFKREGLLLITSARDPLISNGQRAAYLTAIKALPQVKLASIGNAIPADQESVSNSNIVRPGQADSATVSPTVNWSVVGPDYFQLMGTRLVAGRLFDVRYGGDQMWRDDADGREAADVTNVIISRLTVRRMGYPSPQAAIGQTARFANRQVRIVGVVEDMRFYHPASEIPAKLYLFDANPQNSPVIFVRYQGLSEPQMRAKLQQVWRRVAPDVPFEIISTTANLDKYYKPERDRSNLFSIGAGIAALIGCIGLYGMAAFNTSRRVREIGLRKVLGASRDKVVRLLIGQFLRPVIIASVLALPLAWLALRQWLSQFDDAIAISPWFFVLAVGAALVIALGTVGGLALASASTEPGKALRHE